MPVVINTVALKRDVAKTKSASSVRLYNAVIGRLEEYAGQSERPLDRVDAGFVSGFAGFMLRRGLRPSSVRQRLVTLRAMLKPVFGTERKDWFENAFGVIAAPEKINTKVPTLADIRSLSNDNLGGRVFFQKVRDIFMLTFYECMSVDDIRKNNVDLRSSQIQQTVYTAERFESVYGGTPQQFVAKLTPAKYAAALDSIAYVLGLKSRLLPESAVTSWQECARCCDVDPEIIKAVASGVRDTGGNMAHAMYAVAAAVRPLEVRWFVMRCKENAPVEVSSMIKGDVIPAYDYFDSFAIPEQKIHRGGDGSFGILRPLLFVRCTPENALRIKKRFMQSAYMYSLAGSGMPVHIPDGEIQDFMLLCRVGEDMIARYFPEYAIPESGDYLGRKARIAVGDMEGRACRVIQKGKDRYSVVVDITLDGSDAVNANIRISATVPYSFLRFED